MSFPWPVVEDARDLIASPLSEVLHGCALWQILPNEAVRVFVGASLPCVVWGGEVDAQSGETFDLLIAVELGSVVGSDGFE